MNDKSHDAPRARPRRAGSRRRPPLLLLLPGLALLGALPLACQSTIRETACRLAVKRLASAPDGKERPELEAVVSFGRYAIPDIEQESQAAEKKSKLRFFEALRRIGDRDALPLLDFFARWDTDSETRQSAGRVAEELRGRTAASAAR